MNLRDRVPVEDLDAERWRHLEQRVVARVGDAVAAPRRRRLWPVVVTLAAATAVAALWLSWPRSAGMTPPPLAVIADADGAHVDLGDAVIDAEPGTRFEVTRPDGGIRVVLAAGAVSLEVAPRRGRPPLVVDADDVRVRVVGTAFTVRRDPDVSVEVRHGVVAVERAGAEVALHAGEQWSTAQGRVAVGTPPPAAPHPGTTVDYDPLVDRAGGVAPPPPPSGSGAGPVAANPPRERPTPPRPPAPAADPLLDLRRALAAQSLGVAPPGAPAAIADAIAYFQRESVTGRGAAAAAALWGLARTQWAAGKKAEALRSVDAYLRRFANGAELDAVQWLRLRLLCDRSFDDTCRAAAHTVATRSTDPARRALALRVTDTR